MASFAPRRPLLVSRAALGRRPPIGDRHRRRTDRFVASVSIRRIGIPLRPSLLAVRPRVDRTDAGDGWFGAERIGVFGPRLPLTLRRIMRRRAAAAPPVRRSWPRWPEAAGVQRAGLPNAEEPVDWFSDGAEAASWFDESPAVWAEESIVSDRPAATWLGDGPATSPVDLALPVRVPAAAEPRRSGPAQMSGERRRPAVTRAAPWRPAALRAADRVTARTARTHQPPGGGAGTVARAAAMTADGAAGFGRPLPGNDVPDRDGGEMAAGAIPASVAPPVRHTRPDMLLRAWTGSPRIAADSAARRGTGAFGRSHATAAPVARVAQPVAAGALTLAPRPGPHGPPRPADSTRPIVADGGRLDADRATTAGGPATVGSSPDALGQPPVAAGSAAALDRAAAPVAPPRDGSPPPLSAVARASEPEVPGTESISGAVVETPVSVISADQASAESIETPVLPARSERRSGDGPAAFFDPVRAASFGFSRPTIGRWLSAESSFAGQSAATMAEGEIGPDRSWFWPIASGGWVPLASPLVRRMALPPRTIADAPEGAGYAGSIATAGWGAAPHAIAASGRVAAGWLPSAPIGTATSAGPIVWRNSPPAFSGAPDQPMRASAGGVAARMAMRLAAGHPGAVTAPGWAGSPGATPQPSFVAVSAPGWDGITTRPIVGWEGMVQRFGLPSPQAAAGGGPTMPAWFAPDLLLWMGPRPIARTGSEGNRNRWTPTVDRWGTTFSAAAPPAPPVRRIPEPATPFTASPDFCADAGWFAPSAIAPSPAAEIWRSFDGQLAARRSAPAALGSASAPLMAPGSVGVPPGPGLRAGQSAAPAGWFEAIWSDDVGVTPSPFGWVTAGESDPWAAAAPAATLRLRRLAGARPDRVPSAMAPGGGQFLGPGISPSPTGIGEAIASPTGALSAGGWTLPPSRFAPAFAGTDRPLEARAATTLARRAVRAAAIGTAGVPTSLAAAAPVGAIGASAGRSVAWSPVRAAARTVSHRRHDVGVERSLAWSPVWGASAPPYHAQPQPDAVLARTLDATQAPVSFPESTTSAPFAGWSSWPMFADRPFRAGAAPRLDRAAAAGMSRAAPASRGFGFDSPGLTLFRSALPHAPEPSPAQVMGAVGSLADSVGQPLPVAIRRKMERAMGTDLGLVRVHSGPRVARAAEAVGARAMTIGSDVFLPGGVSDSPRSPELPLVAHELAHAVSHRGDGGGASGSTPWVRLARKEADAEQQASGLEAFFAGSPGGTPPHAGAEPVNMTLARSASPQPSGGPALATAPAAPTASTWPDSESIQRTTDDALASLGGAGVYAGGLHGSATAPGTVARIQRAEGDPAAPAAESGAGGGGDDALAERVFKLLQRKLIVERERSGVVGRFGRFV